MNAKQPSHLGNDEKLTKLIVFGNSQSRSVLRAMIPVVAASAVELTCSPKSAHQQV